ncbi:MAG: transglycosylase domain-containing protein [Bacteroidales bacterium]
MKKNKIIFSLWTFFAFIVISILTYFLLISYGVFGFMPSFEQLENPRSKLATQILSDDQVVLGTYFIENRTKTDFEQLSPYLVDALIATEDIRFFSHSGIDLRGLGRVIVRTVVMGDESGGGGSTISQQLAKLLFPREDFSTVIQKINRKSREWIIALKLERSYTKEEIISLYLNEFDFLNLAVGIQTASNVYFNCNPNELNIEQSALLVGMLKNPALFNPIRHPKNATNRRNVVLSQMLKYGKISKQQYDSLTKLPIELSYQRVDHKLGKAPYLREYLRVYMTAKKPEREMFVNYKSYQEDSIRWAENPLYGWCFKNKKSDGSPYDLYRDGLKIYTTINSKMQQYAEEATEKHMKDLQKIFFLEQKGRRKAPYSEVMDDESIKRLLTDAVRKSERYVALRQEGLNHEDIMKIFKQKTKMRVFSWKGPIDTLLSPYDSIRYMKHFLHAGLLSVEPESGFIKAYVGGIDYRFFQYDHVMSQRRQVGSTFKPFLYTLAIQEGFSPCYKVANVPTTFYIGDSTWTPSNAGDMRSGEMVTLAWGLKVSNNNVAAKLMQILKPEPVINIAREMGIKSPILPVPSICLGTPDLTLYEMTGAFTTFVNKGVYTEPIFVTRIEDKFGNVISTFTPKRNDAISEEAAYTMLLMLQGPLNGGTASRMRYMYNLYSEMAGKTGTTNDHSDGWFIGCIPHLVTGVWVGGDERSIRFKDFQWGEGAKMALPIFAYFHQKLYADSLNLNYKVNATFEKPATIKYDRIICDENEKNPFNTNLNNNDELEGIMNN